MSIQSSHQKLKTGLLRKLAWMQSTIKGINRGKILVDLSDGIAELEDVVLPRQLFWGFCVLVARGEVLGEFKERGSAIGVDLKSGTVPKGIFTVQQLGRTCRRKAWREITHSELECLLNVSYPQIPQALVEDFPGRVPAVWVLPAVIRICGEGVPVQRLLHAVPEAAGYCEPVSKAAEAGARLPCVSAFGGVGGGVGRGGGRGRAEAAGGGGAVGGGEERRAAGAVPDGTAAGGAGAAAAGKKEVEVEICFGLIL
ncbi:uncharacterized protein MONOS_6481 [Monocercomonoides exilis]|uniref:uncharacterized protein n=1 Tax=Monocercomonoides exilis TaxID=2049356 RepID=UPI00355A7A3C|nr:hypothetical protein MONOS_6481 [Monocercomonoides exilis]|eukprot:MONOS_6481.1-p1 / transcript=MONOS_6481.1 / gene=MONOS_6481 / organism=Monocercomonoides_exilis_PA203 / gene_product=unspecified product / transcript_product=unspecified product / location=Mono_scaffold00204:84506-85682(+) / protein_length=255 / sequence_SO=supercontig / SO=protein_coding / is_pseudo=false